MEKIEIPHLVADRILRYIDDQKDRLKLLAVCKEWSRAFATAIYQTPCLDRMNSFESLLGLLNMPVPYHPYAFLIQKLDITGGAADNVYMGDLDSCLKHCSNLKILRLERCFHVSNILVESIANNCKNLEQVSNINKVGFARVSVIRQICFCASQKVHRVEACGFFVFEYDNGCGLLHYQSFPEN